MSSIIKKTISVPLGKEDYVIALMNNINFIEVDRKTTGGYMSEEKVQITFEGYDTDYHENNYLKIPAELSGFDDNYFFFFSLRQPYGYLTNDIEKFKMLHNKKLNYKIYSFTE